jgi:hypothetical protein
MKVKHLALAAGAVTLGFFYACTKNAAPQPPIHDTVTVIKTDTLRIPIVPDTPNLKNGLVLYFPFHGSFADSSGNANSITVIGSPVLDYDLHGYAQGAFSSTGNGERVIVANNGSYKVDTAFSVSFDFMIRSSPYYLGGGNYSKLMTFLSIVNTTDATGPTFAIGLNLPALPQNFTFGLNSASNGCSSIGSAEMTDTTNFIPQIGSWYNAICIFTKGTSSIYINGQLVNSKMGGNPSVEFCPASRFVVGGWYDGGPEGFNGKLDEVRMYNRTLNAKEITYLARNFQPGSTKLNPVLKTR